MFILIEKKITDLFHFEKSVYEKNNNFPFIRLLSEKVNYLL